MLPHSASSSIKNFSGNLMQLPHSRQELPMEEVTDKKDISENSKIYDRRRTKLVSIFIYKLKQNASILAALPPENANNIQSIPMRYVFEVCYHLTIVYYYLSIVCLLLMTGWTASLNQFSSATSHLSITIILKAASLLGLVFQIASSAWAPLLIRQGCNCTLLQMREHFTKHLFTFYGFSQLVNAILCVFFLAFPSSRAMSGTYYIFLLLFMVMGSNELSLLEAAYIHTKLRSFQFKIAKILIINILIIHNVSIILLVMAHLDDTTNWLIEENLMGESWEIHYIESYYWSTIILTTIGFGDIVPTNPKQKMIVSFLAIFAGCILAYNISTFGTIFGMLRESSNKVHSNIVTYRRILKRDYKNNVQIDPNLNQRVYEYIESMAQDMAVLDYIQKNQFLNSLPDTIRRQYYKATNKYLFAQVLFFKSLKNQTLSNLAQTFSVQFLNEKDTIEPNDQEIRILEEGRLDFYYNRRGALKTNGQVFDSLEVERRQNIRLVNSDFLTLHPQSNFKIRATSFSILLQIPIDSFHDVLKNDVVDFQFYFSVLHQHSIDSHTWGVVECPRCSSRNNQIRHTAFQCPILTYVPIRTYIIYKNSMRRSLEQPRKTYKRKKYQAPRTSVLKYWKKYLKKNFEMERLRDETYHLKNMRRNGEWAYKTKDKSCHSYYQSKKKELKIDSEVFLEVDVDEPFNFQFYIPIWNPSRLVFRQIQGSWINDSSVSCALGNITYMKGRKFQVQQLNV